MFAAGTVAAMIYNANRGKDTPAISAQDFVPDYKRGEDREAEEPELDIEALASFFGAGAGKP
jgi:hypothetical protein